MCTLQTGWREVLENTMDWRFIISGQRKDLGHLGRKPL